MQNRLEGMTLSHHDWAPSGLVSLRHLDNDLKKVVNFWVHTMVEGYIDEFTAENYQSLSRVEVVFKSRLRGKLVREVSLRLKMFMEEEGILPFSTTMVVA